MADGPGHRLPGSLTAVPPPGDPAALLQAVADALTACQRAGIRVKLRHNAAYTSAGYVLPARDGWVARTLEWSPFWPDDLEDEGDDLDG